MDKFLTEDFLLQNPTAKKLYHEFAKDLPIIDYHSHLEPKMMAENYQFADITELWLGGDHYKWRVMRANGFTEDYITGNKSSFEKFEKWIQTLTQCIGNPLYHWSLLELWRYFDINIGLSTKFSSQIWEKCNKEFEKGNVTVKNLLRKSNVEIICTTDDPLDNLTYHKAIKQDNEIITRVIPAFRPDKALQINSKSFLTWIRKLENVVGIPVASFSSLCDALTLRMDIFAEYGCKVADHALDPIPHYTGTVARAEHAFQHAYYGNIVSKSDVECFQSQLLLFLAKEYKSREWVMQYHIGTIRNCNSKMYELLGPDSGFDSMDDHMIAHSLISLFDALERTNDLPRTIVYSLNPRDTQLLASIIGSFQNGSIPGKIQLGSAWWFNDHKSGIEHQLSTLASQGVLGRFIGMLTDSRSFISFPRHEYFRRILCNLIGTWVEEGQYPADYAHLGQIIQNICYYNARDYFQF